MKTTKFGHGINVMYAVLVTFAIVGGVVKPGELPLAMLVICVLMWVTAQIVRAGALSLYALIHGEDKDE